MESSAHPPSRRRGTPKRRSVTFWIVLLILDMAAIVAVSLLTGQNQADPKKTLIAVFSLIGLYFTIFFAVRQREIAQGEAADIDGAIRGTEIASSYPTLPDPTALTDSELYGAMALRPLDANDLKARQRVWDFQRKGMNTGILIVVLIFLSVPPIYFFHTFVPSFIGAVLITGIAVYRSAGLLGQGLGGLYDITDEVMAPLNLRVTERYTVSIESTAIRPGGGARAVTRGALELQGDRHGRHVKIRTPATGGTRSQRMVEVSTDSTAQFEFRAHDGRLDLKGDAPPSIAGLAERLPRSDEWDGIRGHITGGLITLKRRSIRRTDPLLDLWLGERIADALEPGAQ